MIVAPSSPLNASTVLSVSCDQAGWLENVVAGDTVSNSGGAEKVALLVDAVNDIVFERGDEEDASAEDDSSRVLLSGEDNTADVRREHSNKGRR